MSLSHTPRLFLLIVASLASACQFAPHAAYSGMTYTMHTTAYNWADNSPPNSDQIPATVARSKDSNGDGQAYFSTQNDFSHPDTLAVNASYFTNGNSDGYFKAGDLVFITQLGWFRVEDTTGVGPSVLDMWTLTANATDILNSALNSTNATVYVYHPNENIPSSMTSQFADPNAWLPGTWLNPAHVQAAGFPNGHNVIINGNSVSLPEPSAFAMGLVGMVAVLGFRWVHRRRAPIGASGRCQFRK